MTLVRLLTALAFAERLLSSVVAGNLTLDPASSPAGYVARLLINEVPFPGDPLYRSETDTKQGMLEILWVLDNRVRHIPPGYTQARVANAEGHAIIDIITAPGEVEDFYRNSAGQFTMARRVILRVDYLEKIANDGPPGRFARLLAYAQELARSYFKNQTVGEDLFASLRYVGAVAVTGRGYAWMTADLPYQPGGNFVAVPRNLGGLHGANRFYTLRQEVP